MRFLPQKKSSLKLTYHLKISAPWKGRFQTWKPSFLVAKMLVSGSVPNLFDTQQLNDGFVVLSWWFVRADPGSPQRHALNGLRCFTRQLHNPPWRLKSVEHGANP